MNRSGGAETQNRQRLRILSSLGPGVRKVVGNISWLLVDRVFRMGVGLFVGVWVARYLGPAQYGSLNFAIAFTTIFATLTTLGLDGIVVRQLIQEPDSAPEILGTTLSLRVASSILATVIVIGLIEWMPANDAVSRLLVTISSFGIVFQSFDTIDLFFQSQVRSRLTVWAKNLSFAIIAVVRVYLIKSGARVWTFAAAAAVEFVLGAIGLLLAYRLTGGQIQRWRWRSSRAADLLRQGWPMILAGMAIMIYMRIDTVMLKLMAGDASAGIYAAATRISEVWYFIPAAIVSSVSPAIYRSKADPRLYRDRMQRLFSIMVVISVTIGSAVAEASPWVVHRLYADSYRGAAPVLAVHVWASVFVFLGLAQSPWNLAEDLLKLTLYRTTAGAIANVAMNVVLIPRYAAMGAAWATVISYAVSGTLANAFDARTRPMFLLQLRSFYPDILWRRRGAPG